MRLCLPLCSRLLGIFCLLALAACTANIRMVVNPDNSGKMVLSVKTIPWNGDEKSFSEIQNAFKPGAANASTIEQSIADVLPSLLVQFQGFSAWSNAEYREENHVSYFTITGYFPDATKTSAGYASATPGSGMVQSSAIDKDGNWVLVLSTPRLTQKNATPDVSGKPAADPDVAAMETEESVEMARMFQDMMKEGLPKIDPLISSLPNDAGYGTNVEVGGEILKAEGDYKIEGKSVAGQFNSVKDSWAFIKKIVADEKLLAGFIQLASQRRGKQKMDLNQMDPQTVALFYQFALKNSPTALLPDRLVVKPGQAVFNYDAEVAEARKHPGHLLTLPRTKKSPENDIPAATFPGSEHPGVDGDGKSDSLSTQSMPATSAVTPAAPAREAPASSPNAVPRRP